MTIKEEEALRLVREAALEAAAAGGLPAFLGELERVRVEAVVQAAQPRQATPAPATVPGGRVLTVLEAAARLGRSKWWVYKNQAALPVVRFPTKGWGVSADGLERWIKGRTS